MSDEEGDQVEILRSQHRKEKKDLQAQIQKIKHEVPKGDKKKKKESTEQIAKLQSDLDERQEQEMKKLLEELELSQGNMLAEHNPTKDTGKDYESSQIQVENEDVAPSADQKKKPSKAQKRRDKKAAKDKARDEEIRQQEVDNLSGTRHLETQTIKERLKERNLQIHDIKSDGNCLYNAVNHQLIKEGRGLSNDALRRLTAEYFREHRDDFMPFLVKDNGDPFSSEDFIKYCHDTEHTTAWGGQHEVRALSHVLHTPIEIIQAEGPPIKLGEEFEGKGLPPIVLCYHRHAYGLGEHYNSIEDYVNEEEEDGTS